MKRFDRMLFSVLAIERVGADSNILIIGNRTESDIFKLNSYGFKRITAVDLITYSPKVTLMDAHSMSFQDNSFDIVLLPYVLPYTNYPRLLSSEVIRVTKNNGIVSIAIDYNKTKDIKSVEDIKNLFSGCIHNINFIYNHELSNFDNDTLFQKIGSKASAINLTFSLKK
jgi:SAM-dependent methyltransferase